MFWIIVIVIIVIIICKNKERKTAYRSSKSTVMMSSDHPSVYYAELLIRVCIGLLREEMASDMYIILSATGCMCTIGSWCLSEAIKGRIQWDDPYMLKAASLTDWNNFRKMEGLRIDEYDEVQCKLNYYAPDAAKWYQYVCEYIQKNYPNENRIHIKESNMWITIKNS